MPPERSFLYLHHLRVIASLTPKYSNKSSVKREKGLTGTAVCSCQCAMVWCVTLDLTAQSRKVRNRNLCCFSKSSRHQNILHPFNSVEKKHDDLKQQRTGHVLSVTGTTRVCWSVILDLAAFGPKVRNYRSAHNVLKVSLQELTLFQCYLNNERTSLLCDVKLTYAHFYVCYESSSYGRTNY